MKKSVLRALSWQGLCLNLHKSMGPKQMAQLLVIFWTMVSHACSNKYSVKTPFCLRALFHSLMKLACVFADVYRPKTMIQNTRVIL